MKRPLAILAAAAIPLVLSSPGAFASEPQFNAGIGNGHTSSTTALVTSAKGKPASPHWSARIGTGQQTDSSDSARASKELGRGQPSRIAGVHWTASIGTARAMAN